MRDILFRGKRKDTGEWVQGDLVHSQYKLGDTCVGQHGNTVGIHQVDPETVGQFTGLTDKNGKRIIEGDIVRHYDKVKIGEPDAFVIGKIFWQDKCASFFRTTDEQDNWGYRPIDDSCVYEVIGNIHDNPELLEVTE